MATKLSEVLEEMALEHAQDSVRNKEMLAEWRDAVNGLFNQLREWLALSDPKQFLEVELDTCEVSEPDFGRYKMPRLDIRAFGRWIVALIPKARLTIKTADPQQSGAPSRATGRVDITDELRRYVLYRFSTPQGEQWFIDNVAARGELVPLSRESFETVLLSYLK